ncbi:contractile injection system tape measure protein [Flavobacterium sp. N1736]|uniref:contractile injection system tape measure protein n=1 Tax=Flavobacterium sp. N1736 TaxID=2986823 RepID=UPI0022258B66|nr:contractile injection system tape measure protein [Flavobacterium sp. N1736]
MTKKIHSIQKVFLEIETPSMAMADSIKNNLAMFLKNELFPLLEKQFNNIENIEDQIIQIEKLDFSIQSDTKKNDLFFSNSETKNDIKNQLEKEVQKTINELKKSAKNESQNASEWQVISSKDKEIKTLLYFIENGSMPWWIIKEDEKVFFEKIDFNTLQNETFSIPFRRLIHQKKVRKRIINQFSNNEIALLSAAFLSFEVNQKIVAKSTLLKILDNQSHVFKASFWQMIFEVWTDKKYFGLISFYDENQAVFVSKKMSFDLFIQNIKTFALPDFTDKELQKTKDNYLISKKAESIEKTESIIKPTDLKINKEIIYYEEKETLKEEETSSNINKEENTTELKVEINSSVKDTLISKPEEKEPLHPEENTSNLTTENPSEKEESILKPEEKEPLYTDENISELKVENLSVKEESISKNEDEIEEENIDFKTCYVQNAGLIILHPFLKEMLKSCELIDEKNAVSDKELAAHILHYAATKRENDYEHAMLFEKFLCGIPLQQSIRRDIKIDDRHKQHVEEMLESVVEHWSALKNTSTGVLRSEFLQREGKLDLTESNPKVTIERKTQDLLLEKIPWNISIVKIPWLEKLIYSQW